MTSTLRIKTTSLFDGEGGYPHVEPSRPASRSRGRHTGSRRLLDQLDDSTREDGIVSIVAPSGCGKTSLISDWRQELSEREGAWVESYCVLDSCGGESLLEILRALLDAYLKDRSGRTLHCIIEDVHLIDPRHLGEAFKLLARLSDEGAHIVVTSAAWSTRLLGLFARARVRTIDAPALRFTREETRECLALSADGIADNSYADRVFDFTGGWRMGVHLLSIEHDAGASSRSFSKNKHLDGYFKTLLEDICSEEMIEFLHMTSCIDELTPELCAHVVKGDLAGQDAVDHARALIAEAEELGLYISRKTSSVDSPASYDKPFKLWLQSSLTMLQPSVASAVNLRASRWFGARGLNGESVKHLLMAGASLSGLEDVWKLVLPEADFVDHTERVQWISSLSAEEATTNPGLCVLAGWFFVRSGMHREADVCVRRCEELLDALNDLREDERDYLAVHTRCLKVKCLGMMGGSREYAELARDLIDSPAVEADTELRCIMVHGMGESLEHLGEIKESQERYREALALSRLCGDTYALGLSVFGIARRHAAEGNVYEAEQLCRTHMDFCPEAYRGLLYTLVARLHLMGSRLDEAEDALQRAETLLSSGNLDFKLEFGIAKAILLQARGEIEAACTSVMHSIAIAKGSHIARRNVLSRLQALWAYLLFVKGDHLRCRKALAELARSSDPDDFEAGLMKEAVRIRLLILDGDAEEAVCALSRCVEEARGRGHIVALAELRILESRLHLASGNGEKAFLRMSEALDLGAQCDLTHEFLREGDCIASVLRESVSTRRLRRGTRRFCEALLESLGSRPADEEMPESRQGRIKRDMLTARERSVLDLLGKGMSRGEIADELGISHNTVKVHIAHIYEKLGVGNRLDAIHSAREEVGL